MLTNLPNFRLTAVACMLAAVTLLPACGGGSSETTQAATEAAPDAVATASDDSVGPPQPPLMTDSKLQTESNIQALAVPETSSALEQDALRDASGKIAAAIPGDEESAAPMSHALSVSPAAITSGTTSIETRIYVSATGNDAWSGSLATASAKLGDGPVRTLATAQLRARTKLAAMTAGAERQTVRVVIAAGQYLLPAPLTFTPLDSGAPGFPVVYEAQTPGSVTVSGGLPLGTVAPRAAGDLVTVPAPAIDASNMRGGTQLYAEGRRATLARTPNAGNFWFVQRSVALPSEPAGQLGQEAFAPTPAVLSTINGLTSADRSRAIVTVMQSWTSGRHRVSELAAPAGTVRLKPRAKWAYLNFGTDQRFMLENVPSALDAPGEWIWDGDTVRYISTAADAGRSFWLVMPVLDRLIVIKGNESGNNYVRDLEFRGLSFAYTRYLTPDEGYVDNQAGSLVGAAIEVDAARRVVIDNCSISRTGGYGVWFRNSVRDSVVSNSTMYDLGAGGVKVGLASQSPTYAAGTGANRVYANTIKDTGKIIPGAVGVWVGQSFDNAVANNLIANTTYSGISVGWTWAYGTPTSGRNSITDNLLVNIGQGNLSDIGAIYTAGESPGTVITGNVIREVRPYPGYGVGAWGIYNDGASSNTLIEHNVVIGSDAGGYVLNYGRDNTVQNNLLAFGERSEVRVSASSPGKTNLTFHDNLLLPKNASPLAAYATAPDVSYSGNLVSDRVLTTPSDLAKCGAGCTRVSTTISSSTDPRVVALSNPDANTASWLGIVSDKVGPPSMAASVIPKVATSMPAVVVAPPIGYSLDLEGTALAGQPLNMRYSTGKSVSNIQVVQQAGTPSGKCLQFNDSADNPDRWQPFSWATLNHSSGTSVAEFAIKIDADTNFLHEWRDDATTYTTGPSLRIKPTGVEVAGKVVAKAPIGAWLTIKVTAGLSSAAGTWTLEVKDSAGVVTTVPNLKVVSKGWSRLNWLGFVSDAHKTSTACLAYATAVNR